MLCERAVCVCVDASIPRALVTCFPSDVRIVRATIKNAKDEAHRCMTPKKRQQQQQLFSSKVKFWNLKHRVKFTQEFNE